MKAIAAYALLEVGLGQRKSLLNLGHGGVKGGVEAADCDDPGKGLFTCANTTQVKGLMQWSKRTKCLKRLDIVSR